VQKEVADRIVASDKKESILSLSVKAYGTPKKIMKVPAQSFSPAPKVDSAIINIQSISRNFFSDCDEDFFFKVVRTGFAHKRKLLSRNLTDLGISHDVLLSLFERLEISPKTRSETLSVHDWKKIAQALRANT
jgi:16S rRNA (adenine1518-N6/adenine1519-N6)-dimethyltransferase